MKYPIFSLLGLVLLGSSCFNPHIKEGGFACSGSQAGQCPNGFFCVNNVCVDNPSLAPGPGGTGGNGQNSDDMAVSMMPDLARPMMSMPDLHRPDVTDMAMRSPPDLTQLPPPPPPPDMAKPVGCAHDYCTTGSALKASCDPCVAAVCAQDSVCCTSKWDSLCVSETDSDCSFAAGC